MLTSISLQSRVSENPAMVRLGWRERCTYEDILFASFLDGGNDSCGNHGLLPWLVKIDEVKTILVTLKNVSFHLLGHVLGANVNLSKKLQRIIGKCHVLTGKLTLAEWQLTSAAIMLTRSFSLFPVYKIDILYNFFFVQKRYPSYFKIINFTP